MLGRFFSGRVLKNRLVDAGTTMTQPSFGIPRRRVGKVWRPSHVARCQIRNNTSSATQPRRKFLANRR